MQNRRDFIKRAGVMLAGGVIAPGMIASCKGSGGVVKSAKYIGLQLYSLRDLVKEAGIESVLKTVSEMGYKNLETAGYEDGKIYGLLPSEFGKIVSNLGLKCTSAHLSPSQAYTKETESEVYSWWDRAIAAHQEIGLKYLIQPWISVTDSTTLDDLKLYCDYFTAVGEKTAAAGISFGYHNHAFEFREIDGQLIYDYLLDNVCPDHVMFEMDVYWLTKGGKSPVEYLQRRPTQFKAIHIKDEKEIGASGEIDFKPIFDQIYANGIEDWYVEVEQYTNNDPVGSVRQSYEYLSKAEYVK